jgi:outer membrane lipoprotein LolB
LKRRLFLALALAAPLSGCALLATQEGAVGEIGPAVENFSVSGRLALRQGERRDHLQFDWQHSPQGDTVLLLSPLGQGLAEIVRDVRGARMNQPNQAPIEAPDIESLAQQIFGTALPLQELGDWLRGARGVAGEVAGWRIAISQTVPYRQSRLPRRLDASRDEVALTLIVDEWGAGE